MNGLDVIVRSTIASYIQDTHGEEQKFAASYVDCRVLEVVANSEDGGLLWAVRRSKNLIAELYEQDNPGATLGPLRTLHFAMEPPVVAPCQRVFYRLVTQ
jgi:hypothetical protein